MDDGKIAPKLTDVKRHYSENQQRWREYSEQVIEEFAEKTDSFVDFFHAYKFLANKRQTIAEELCHGKKYNITHHYGDIRDFHTDVTEDVISSVTDEHAPWWIQTPHILKKVNALIPATDEDKSQYITYDRLPYRTHITHYIEFSNHITIDGKLFSKGNLSSINLHVYPHFQQMRLTYANLTQTNLAGNLHGANIYFQQLLGWNQKDKVENFLGPAGFLAHLLAHLLLVKRGNASIVEWMIQGVAKKHGIDLGGVRRDLPLSWDWQALVTPDYREYAKWYVQNAFNVKPLDPKPAPKPLVHKFGFLGSLVEEGSLGDKSRTRLAARF